MDNEKDKIEEVKNEEDKNEEDKTNDKKALIIKIAIVVLAVAVVAGGIFFACSRSGKDGEGLDSYDDQEYDFDTEYVTDEEGNYVTDKNGEKVTKKVTSTGETVNNNGTTTTGKFTTMPPKENGGSSEGGGSEGGGGGGGQTDPDIEETKSGTTAFDGYETVPKTSASGTPVRFSSEDINTIENMLEVPYLYLASYENTDGVPIGPATQTAIWMASRSTGDREDASGPLTFSANEIVLDLFKYYGQTVVNFKSQCNNYAVGANAAITYNPSEDTFSIGGYTPRVQTVTITSVEDVGDNNFYKVTANVSGCNKSKVVAIVQKNRLDPTLGFSIKALKWS